MYSAVSGFADPVHDSQRVFRRLLDATSHPGRVLDLESGLVAPAPLYSGTLAILLALADFETPAWLCPEARTEAVISTIRFRSGAPLADQPTRASFAVIMAGSGRPRLDSFALGTDLDPDGGATLIVQVPSLVDGPEVSLSGPGIEGIARLVASGLDADFWAERKAMEPLFPRGLDIILVARDQIVVVPRSSELEA